MRTSAFVIACGLVLVAVTPVLAGMPAPLPSNPERVSRLGDTPLARLQTISFFLLIFLLSATAFWGIWNYLRRDFPMLPQLTFGQAVLGVFLWGVLFVIVLTMISGARELMTPGAWRKQGATYKLADNVPLASQPETDLARRRAHLEQLRTALWQFAATHSGHFPGTEEMALISADLWAVPFAGGLNYLYVPGRSAGYLPDVLAYEPDFGPDRRLVLRANGDIAEVPSADLRALRAGPPPADPVNSEGKKP